MSIRIGRFILRRFASGVFVLFGVTLITFILAHLVPGNPIFAWIGKEAAQRPELVQAYIKKYHLNDPLYLQYIYYVNGLLHLDLGYSPTRGEPVAVAISQTLPYTLQLVFLALIFIVVLGSLTGIVAAKYSGKLPDRIIYSFYVFGVASPPFFVALVLILIFSLVLPVLPTGGLIDISVPVPYHIIGLPLLDALIEGNVTAFSSLLFHAILPSLALALTVFGLLTRVLRANILGLLNSGFVRAARARGVSENRIFFGYAFKNSLMSVITLTSILTVFVLVGDIFVEYVFAYPGMGQYAVQAALYLDYPAILGTTLTYATIIVIVNVLTDLLYGLVDPRVRYAQH